MGSKKRASNQRNRLGAMTLAVLLVCALMTGAASAAPATGALVTAHKAAPKPTVTIQGNVVVDKKKPTGFYELALCVKTARTITDKSGNPVTEEDYAKILAEDEENDTTHAIDDYDIKNYPFSSVSAAVHINLDALTAVSWGAGKPIYQEWDADSSSYKGNDAGYPRGIDLSNADQPDIFTKYVTQAKLDPVTPVRIRLDAASPDEVTNATALIEDYDPVTGDALLTLSANTTTTPNVVYPTSTPVVVVRFAYDQNRFPDTIVGDPNDQVNNPNLSPFRLPLDRGDTAACPVDKIPLTYLANRNWGGMWYSKADELAAASTSQQVVWYRQNLEDNQTGENGTEFYYYLGADDFSSQGKGSYSVFDNGTLATPTLTVPDTKGSAVLAKKDGAYPLAGTDPDPAEDYSFFQNLLTYRKGEKKLKLELVNAETYRKPTGGGGTTILFYDWDDSLIGSLVVDKGDVRAEVEEYIEENLVHPDLRPGTVLDKMGGKLPDYAAGGVTDPDAVKYQMLANSLERDYTYRGKYPYNVTGTKQYDTTDPDEQHGEDYPLTNKLDYVFTKRVNTAAVYGADNDGDGIIDETETTYMLPHKLTDAGMADAALYPYTYGWAVVEDTSPKNQSGWKVMYDAAKLEDTWTTIGVGELSSVDPDYYDKGAVDKTLPTGTGAVNYTAPVFLAEDDEGWIDPANGKMPGATYTNKYAYELSTDGAESYFRFADFSDIDKELERYQKKNGTDKDTLIVKAVYEEGEQLLSAAYPYTLRANPYYNKLNNSEAAAGGAYSVRLGLERSNDTFGTTQGVQRMRAPSVRQDTTVDYKWIESDFPEVDHDLLNPDENTARNLSETTYTKVDTDNGEWMQITLSLSPRMNKVDYFLVDTEGSNFVSGSQRSTTNFSYDKFSEQRVMDNYNYRTTDSVVGDKYYDSDYATRDGSRGFVLSGTLNNIMQQATECKRGTINETRFNSYATYQILNDANLRLGDEPANYGDQATLRTKILAVADKILNDTSLHTPDFWNSELKCAELTYHQLQWYIIDGSLDARAVADSKPIDFCHYHESCAAAMSTIPDTWDEIIDAARKNNTSDLSKMTTTNIETLTYLRTDANGSQFDSANNFTTAIIDAVTKLDAAHAGDADYKPTWWELQYVLLNGKVDSAGDMRKEAAGKYWWYDGSTTAPALPTVADEQWPALLQAARDAYIPYNATLKDGLTSDWTTTTHLAPAKTAFDRNAATSAASHPAWRTLTGNLVLDHHEDPVLDDEDNPTGEYTYTTDKFPDFDDFQTRLINAMQLLDPGGTGGSKSPTWRELQLAILQVEDPTDDAGAATGDEYWWYNGAKPFKITNLRTLIEAVRRIYDYESSPIPTVTQEEYQPAKDAWDKLTVADLEGSLTNMLRWNKIGQTAAQIWPTVTNEELIKKEIFGYLQKAQADIEAASGSIDWATVQYHIINNKVDDISAIRQQQIYYWWKDGGEGVEVDFSGAANVSDKLQIVMQATFRTEFGDPKAEKSVADQATDGDLWELTRLVTAIVNETDPNVNPDDHYVGPDTAAFARQSAYPESQLDDFLDMITEFRQAAQADQNRDYYDMPEFYWYQVQYYVLNSTYKHWTDPEIADKANAQTGYWWYDRDERDIPEPPPPPPENEPTDAFTKLLEDAIAAGGKITLTKDQFDEMQITGDAAGKSPTLANTNKIMNLLMADVKASPYYNATTGEVSLTWVQIQYYFAKAYEANKLGKKPGVLTDQASALAGLKGMGFKEDDFPAGVKLASTRTFQNRAYVYAFLSTALPTTF